MSKPSWPQEVRDLAAERSQLRCEGCGGPGPLQLHHRKFKSRGGQNTIQNALALCGLGNIDGCHGVAHGADKTRDPLELGWAVSSGVDPATVPVRLALHGVVHLLDDGTVK